MLITVGIALGAALGAWTAVLWGLRRSRRLAATLLLVGMAVAPVGYLWSAELLRWPTPGSLLRSQVGTAGVVAVVLVAVLTAAAVVVGARRAGLVARVERWSGATGGDPVSAGPTTPRPGRA